MISLAINHLFLIFSDISLGKTFCFQEVKIESEMVNNLPFWNLQIILSQKVWLYGEY